MKDLGPGVEYVPVGLRVDSHREIPTITWTRVVCVQCKEMLWVPERAATEGVCSDHTTSVVGSYLEAIADVG